MTRSIVIVGDGLAGWSMAAALSHAFRDTIAITVVPHFACDPPAIPTGAEILTWLGILSIKPEEFIRKCEATFRFGSYLHDGQRRGFIPLDDAGSPGNGARPPSFGSSDMGDLVEEAVRRGRLPVPLAKHGFHLATEGFRTLLRERALAGGVRHARRGVAARARPSPTSRTIELADGHELACDLFVDATGPARRLSDAAERAADGVPLKRHNRHFRSRMAAAAEAMTRVEIHDRGWREQLPLRERIVTCDVIATETDERRLAEAWRGNRIVLGDAFGVIDGVDGAAWSLIQKGVTQFVQLFPPRQPCTGLMTEYNRRMARHFDCLAEAASLRQRRIWKDLPLSSELDRRIILYRRTGRLSASDDLAVSDSMWRALFAVHGVAPPMRHPLSSAVAADEQAALRERWRAVTASFPEHRDILRMVGDGHG